MISEDKIVPYKTSELPVTDGPWLVFAPHADDESFGMGGTLAKAVDRGIQVHLVIMTDGALGGEGQNLVETRKAEATHAAASLGLEAPVFLDNSDRGLELNNKTLEQVTREIKRVDPAAVFFPGVFELHPDHRNTALIVWKALSSLTQAVPVPVSYEVLVQSPVNTLVDITAYIRRKKEAMACYESQLAESSYIETALALNTLRSLTIPAESKFAEGFYCFEPEALGQELVDLTLGKISSYLAK